MRYFSSRRALSSIVTGMVLLVATVILGSAVVMWSNGAFSVSKSITTTLYATNVNKFTEQLVVENAWFGTIPSKFINVTLYNVGSTGISVTDIQIKNSTKTVDIPMLNDNILPQKTNSTKIPYAWKSGIPLSIFVTTAKGSVVVSDISP